MCVQRRLRSAGTSAQSDQSKKISNDQELIQSDPISVVMGATMGHFSVALWAIFMSHFLVRSERPRDDTLELSLTRLAEELSFF